MRAPRFVGSQTIRWGTVCSLLLGLAVWMTPAGAIAISSRMQWIIVLACCGLAFLGTIHGSRQLFELWSRWTKRMQEVLTVVFFGAIYLVVVPPFAALAKLLDPLGMYSTKRSSNWIVRSNDQSSSDSLDRLG